MIDPKATKSFLVKTIAAVRSAMAEVDAYYKEREAVQDRCEVLHEFTLFDLQARFADVVGLENAMEYLRGL